MENKDITVEEIRDKGINDFIEKNPFLKCPRCKCWRDTKDFISKKSRRRLKTCIKCREFVRKYNWGKCINHPEIKAMNCKKCLCPHGEYKHKCHSICNLSGHIPDDKILEKHKEKYYRGPL